MFMMFTEADRQVLLTILHKVHRMTLDISGLQASATHAQNTIVKLISLVEAALASSNPAQDADVQKSLDGIKQGLDNAANAGDTEAAKAAQPTNGASPAADPAVSTGPAAA